MIYFNRIFFMLYFNKPCIFSRFRIYTDLQSRDLISVCKEWRYVIGTYVGLPIISWCGRPGHDLSRGRPWTITASWLHVFTLRILLIKTFNLQYVYSSPSVTTSFWLDNFNMDFFVVGTSNWKYAYSIELHKSFSSTGEKIQ